MDTINIIPYSDAQSPFVIAEFEEVLQHSMLRYSMRNLILAGITSQDSFNETLERAMQVCSYAGINIAHHFEQVYVFDAETDTMYVDWLMSKKGVKLIIMQSPRLNEKIAHWLWELADV